MVGHILVSGVAVLGARIQTSLWESWVSWLWQYIWFLACERPSPLRLSDALLGMQCLHVQQGLLMVPPGSFACSCCCCSFLPFPKSRALALIPHPFYLSSKQNHGCLGGFFSCFPSAANFVFQFYPVHFFSPFTSLAWFRFCLPQQKQELCHIACVWGFQLLPVPLASHPVHGLCIASPKSPFPAFIPLPSAGIFDPSRMLLSGVWILWSGLSGGGTARVRT